MSKADAGRRTSDTLAVNRVGWVPVTIRGVRLAVAAGMAASTAGLGR